MSNVKVPELSSEDLLSGDEDAMREKIAAVVDKAVADVEAKHQKEQPSPERQGAMDEAMKAFAVFGDSDEDIRDYAKTLFEKEVAKLPAEAGEKEIKAAAEQVSKKVAKLMVAKGQTAMTEGNEGPISLGNGSAAAAHTTDEPPKTIEQAEAYAERIAASFGQKQ